jgi:small subunit ribosomal protein S20
LAHSKSALKRWRQALVRRDRNRSVKSQTRTVLNKAVVAIESDAASAEAAVRSAISALDKAAQKGVIHANAAARGKSRLLKRFNLATANAVLAASAAAPAPEAEKPARGRTAAKKPDAKPAKPAPRSRAAAPKQDEKPAPRRTRKS